MDVTVKREELEELGLKMINLHNFSAFHGSLPVQQEKELMSRHMQINIWVMLCGISDKNSDY